MTEAELEAADYRLVAQGSRIQIWEKHEGPTGSRRRTDELIRDSEDGSVREFPPSFDIALISISIYERDLDLYDLVNAVAPVGPLRVRLLARFAPPGAVVASLVGRGGGGQ